MNQRYDMTKGLQFDKLKDVKTQNKTSNISVLELHKVWVIDKLLNLIGHQNTTSNLINSLRRF